MGIRDSWRNLFKKSEPIEPLEPERKLHVRTGFNMRELGGYACGSGQTLYQRFMRSGSLETLSDTDEQRLYDYGVRMVLDLRGNHEVEMARDRIVGLPGVRYCHVRLYDFDLSDPKLAHVEDEDDYLSSSYLTMLANHKAIRDIFAFLATATPDDCVLFHCAAGMDRTGVTAMLILGLCGASARRLIADYLYSFGSVEEVDFVVFQGGGTTRRELKLRLVAIHTVLKQLIAGYGSIEAYLKSCGVTEEQMAAVRTHLLG